MADLANPEMGESSVPGKFLAEDDEENLAISHGRIPLEERSAYFHQLLESSPDAMVVVNGDGQIVFVNAQTEEMFGYKREEILHQTLECLMPERFRTQHVAHREHYMKNPYVRSMGSGLKLYALRKNGEEFPVEIRLSPIETSEGMLVSSSIRDVTEQKKLEAILHAKNQELEILYQREQKMAILFQKASLPGCLPQVPGLTFHHYYEPGESDVLIGGDWYDAFLVPDGRVAISIGDIGGSGLHASIIMTSVRQAIRGAGYACPDPILILNVANQVLHDEYPDVLATAFIGILDPATRRLAYASAGHPPPLLRCPDGALQALNYSGMLLGVGESVRDHAANPAQRINIPENSYLVLYTDGLVEATALLHN